MQKRATTTINNCVNKDGGVYDGRINSSAFVSHIQDNRLLGLLLAVVNRRKLCT